MTIPSNIARFKVVRELGRGSQGVVYLATDPHLERRVAIKTLKSNSLKDEDRQKRLMQEARTVSKLQHPNIIPLYEAGESGGMTYLVFEYVDGISLRDQIKTTGPFVVHTAVSMMSQILAGISLAHNHGVIHRDLTPANIMIDKNKMPRIMDFGISVLMTGKEDPKKDISGTPCYMSPEHFSKSPLSPRSDIFSLGLILYEMVVAQPAVTADNEFTVMFKIANEPIIPPSQINPVLDNNLDRIIQRALEKKSDRRYPDALEMKRELDSYLKIDKSSDQDKPSTGATHSTLDFLLRRIRLKGDFPTFSTNIIEINKKSSISGTNYTSASELANTILKDYSLTNKLLKLVNSAFYGQFAGSITTISRAVVVLGFEQVRMAASSLLLFDHLQNKLHETELKDAAVTAFISGIIARDITNSTGLKETEEAFICSMLHNLGKHLALFYFPEEYKLIMNLMAQKGIDERVAARSVLGISYEDLGAGIAKTWKFPDRIINSMKSLPEGKVGKAESEAESLRNLAAFSNELCSIVNSTEEYEKDNELNNLLKRFEKCFSISKEKIADLLDSAGEEIDKFSGILKIDSNKSPFMKRLTGFLKDRDEKFQSEAKKITGAATTLPEEEVVDYQGLEVQENSLDSDVSTDPNSLLIRGIQDITNTLVGEYGLNDVLTIILETMFRGFDFHRVLLCITESCRTKMKARLGFGMNIEEINKNFCFRFNEMSDIFSLSVLLEKDISIDDSSDPRIKVKIPEWYHRFISAPAFALFPINIDKSPVGLFYADRQSPGQVISEKGLNYMRTLRSQAILAIKQKRI